MGTQTRSSKELLHESVRATVLCLSFLAWTNSHFISNADKIWEDFMKGGFPAPNYRGVVGLFLFWFLFWFVCLKFSL